MACRVNSEDVRAIIDLEDTMDLHPHISAANVLVTRYLSGVTDMTDAERKEIERWLAAHFACIHDPRAMEEQIGDARVRYAKGKYGLGLDATLYGQQVKILDHSGLLSGVGRGRAFMEVL